MEAKLKKALPSEYLPSAGAASMIFVLICGHILFHLLCYWHVGFRASFLFSPADAVVEGVYALIKTLPHHGKPDMALVARNPVSRKLTLEFQRRKYEFMEDGEDVGDAELVGATGRGAVVAVSPSLSSPLSFYTMKGLSTDRAKELFDVYGENRLSIRTPTLFEMWSSQLISPVPVFQFFCSVLWMLDEYWQYTMMTFFTIMLLEAGTAFQRLKTLGQLTKMSMKAYPVLTLRDGKWRELSTQELQPGDLISLMVSKGDKADSLGDVVPCDCLLLNGSAVVNEASLTGESVPAMKDQVAETEKDDRLDIDGRHRIHTLFSGTTLVDVKQVATSVPGVPEAPTKGCLCYVLRTGFSSSQGSLMQMIEFSTESVAGDTRETFMALLLLLVFAIIAAVYVFQKGVAKGDKTTHELLIKSVLIITSVVPRQLPMQMALAVNTALMALMKAGVMCTEPFRVPLAGKITHALFDKTGTLTTDTLVPSGIVNNAKVHEVLPVIEAGDMCSIVLAGCHSLVSVGDDSHNIVGDPIEVAALKGVDWRYDPADQTAHRGNLEAKQRLSKGIEKEMKAYKPTTKKYKELTASLEELSKEIKKAEERAKKDKLAVQIKHRFHFNSQLQRMCVIASVKGLDGTAAKTCALVKGSPEAVRKLLAEGEEPEWFEDSFTSLMEDGMRVLALAYKWMPSTTNPTKTQRSECESDLKFAGFISFSCRVRNDTSAVIGALSESDHQVSMITGDGPLTALHVAKHVGICAKPTSYVLEVNDDKVEWVGATGKSKDHQPFDVAATAAFAAEHNLMTTEANMEKAAEVVGDTLWDVMTHIRVFARMSPPGKAKVIRALQDRLGAHVLMCGDGSNDVGALKQADVGLALLSGYGNANTGQDGEGLDEGLTSEEALNKHQKELDDKATKANAVRRELLGQKQKEMQSKQREWLEEELKRREEAGQDTGMFGQMQAMQAVLARFKEEMRKEEREVGKVANVYAPSIEDVMANADTDSVMIRPGDASVAASFTSRMPTIKATVDLIRQGRCTLLSALQQQQIMMLESIIHAYTLSALSLEGARQSERQMMASGWLLTIATLAFSYATPIDKMHYQRPLRSLFHPAAFFSMAGQAMIHVYCLQRAVTMSTDAMGPDELASVVEFHRKAKAHEVVEEVNPDDPFGAFSEVMATWSMPFKPNLLNTVVFLVETSQIVAVLFVNYKGRPWMKGVMENHALFLSLFTTFAGVAYVAWGISPEVNAMLHFASFPNDDFRWETISLVAISVLGTLVWDRIATAIFAPHIFKIMLQEALSTSISDVLPVFSTLAKVVMGFTLLSTVNPLILMGGYWLYRNYTKKELGD
eukprot:TRINITY_DN9076_c1_g2_i1.p1 TRINITY_DN9076_c1_g2~~TRINITY_DN9076_c1_g2_i1.p1  ORF type:complete len:1488 (+),score=730.92 TRINITY_DN9076_c1_g2_i1:464-4465(+)